MKDRLKQIRKDKGLNQQEFADKIGINRGTLANYEVGRNVPIDAVIKLICDKFDVNEQWLRTGEGDPYVQMDKDNEMHRLVDELLADNSQEMKRRLATAILRLTPEQMENGLNWIKNTFGLIEAAADRGEPAAVEGSTAANQTNITAANVKNPVEMTREEVHTEIDRQFDNVEEGKSTAVQDTASGSFG